MSLNAFLRMASAGKETSDRGGTDAFVEGRCYDVTPFGVRFTVDTWDDGRHVFGPAPWPMGRMELDSAHDHEATQPARGDLLLVLFLGRGIDKPWVLGWWP